MAHNGTLGHFLPYLLGRRLKAVLWPDAGEGRAALIFLALICVLYGAGLAFMLNHDNAIPSSFAQKLVVALNGIFYVSALLVDFMPSYRPVQRPLPDHFPVSGRLNLLTAFLLDLVTVRRVILLLFLLVALAGAPHAWRPLGLNLLVLLSAGTASFNLRLLLSIGRWRHPLFALNVLCLLAAAGWLSTLVAQPLATTALAVLAVAGPLVLWGVALGGLGEKFSARYLTTAPESKPENQLLARLSPEWKAYLRKCWPALSIALVFKLIILVICSRMTAGRHGDPLNGVFWMSFLPTIGFTYVNNNLFGAIGAVTANEIVRLGLTKRLLLLYIRLVGPVLLLDCLVSVTLLIALFPQHRWPLLGLLPLAAATLLALGLWGSLYKAKAIGKSLDLANMRGNASNLINLLSIVFGAALFFMPWWWARIALAAVVTLTAWVPVRRVLRNEGDLRRQLWHDLKA
ncbi:hypothetical protein [Hymenobacter wooponensis]|uniref:Uncharacterized protein n=1 Tax=Hymenobacter wooponensis TaxID=1525360 RepID=A0A4Z0MES2_9BACT|nr:hypothetical protein [Hymenobacter wooponensis]TGD78253.1 hypothetical protein EU557_19265 [Hymenobacter wooponensis]